MCSSRRLTACFPVGDKQRLIWLHLVSSRFSGAIYFFYRGKEDSDMKAKILMAVSALATMFAAFAASSACYWWIYQPEEPASLQDK